MFFFSFFGAGTRFMGTFKGARIVPGWGDLGSLFESTKGHRNPFMKVGPPLQNSHPLQATHGAPCPPSQLVSPESKTIRNAG